MVNAAHHVTRSFARTTRVRFESSARLVVRLVLAVILVLALTPFAGAQTGSVAGNVVDETNAVVRGAQVVLTGPSARHTQVTGATGEYRFDDVPAGAYRLSVFVLGFAEAMRDNVVVSSGEVAMQPIQLAIAGVNETVIVSASRSASALIDAPATMTVLPSSVLEASPSQSYADLLRSVPGMNAIQTSARDVNLTSRQATTLLATSQLALVDGRSVYLDFFGMILWDFVPTNPSDIRQIEVVRGPASAVWGANALTGVVNIVTKSPRETRGNTNVTLSAGLFDRNAGSLKGSSDGALYGVNVSTSQVINDTLVVSRQRRLLQLRCVSRPVGRIPVIIDPRDPAETATVGGAFYPADAPGQLGTAFQNQGTSQPKFDARVDQELQRGRISYSGGMAGTDGTIHTGIGPFDIQPGSVMSYGKCALHP